MTKKENTDTQLEIEKERNRQTNRSFGFQVVTFLVSGAAAIFAFLAESRARENAEKIAMRNSEIVERYNDASLALEGIKSELQGAGTRGELLLASVPYMERMVNPDFDETSRQRACFVSLQLALVEPESKHILKLHAKFLEQRPPVEGEVPDMCGAFSAETISSPAGEARPTKSPSKDVVTSTPTAPSAQNGSLADSVAVLASYRMTNKKIACEAKEKLGERLDVPENVVVARSRSNHAAVVYSATEDSVPLDVFFETARNEGLAARERISTNDPDADAIDQQNLQYVADAYVTNTKNWELLDCP